MALHGHQALRRRRTCGVPAGLAGWNSPPMVGVLFGIQVSGTYWSLRYRVGLEVGQQGQLMLGPGALVGWVGLKV